MPEVLVGAMVDVDVVFGLATFAAATTLPEYLLFGFPPVVRCVALAQLVADRTREPVVAQKFLRFAGEQPKFEFVFEVVIIHVQPPSQALLSRITLGIFKVDRAFKSKRLPGTKLVDLLP